MFGHASGASNGSTSSSPFFRTQYSSPFGTAVGNSNAASGASNGSTSPSPFFRTQYSSPFGTAVGNSNAASGALNGSTSAPSVFANQSLNPFGVGTASNGSTSAPFVFANQSLNTFGIGTAGNNTSPFVQSSPSYPRFGEGASTVSPFGSSANAASCASFGRTSSSPFFANQSSGPFGTAVATNADPFGQSSSRFTGFVDRTNASTSGQTSSSFGGFGEAAASTTSLFGSFRHIFGPSLNTFRGAPFTTPASTLQPSIFRPAGGGPATADNSCGGTRTPYQPTPDEENLPSWNNASRVLTSISAMNCYCNKSHEELRLEDYKQTRNRAGNNTSPFVQSSSPSYPRFGEGATTVSPFCSSANAASCASFGCTSSSPFFANQSSGPFGTPVGAATVSPFGSSTNAASCAAFGCTSSSPFFANQSSGPFGTAVATNADPFGQSSSRFTGFVDRTNASTSGQTSSSFGGFGVALPATIALPATAPFTTPASTLQPSIFRPGGGGPATADNSCGGTRAPYQPTPAEEDHPSWNNHNLVLNSISAMNCYCNKSHEELRLEDYKQTRNGGLFSASHVPGVSNPLSSHVSWLPPPCEPLASTFNRSSENPIQRTDPSSSLDSDKDRTTPVQTSPVQTSVAQTLPAPTPTTTTTMSNQTINVNLNDTTLSITVSGGASFIPITLAFIPQYPQVSNPTTALPLLHPEITLSNPCMLLLNPTSSASTTNPANAHLSTIAETTSHVSPSAGVLGEQITNPSPSAPPAPTNAAPSGSASSFKLNLPATQHSSSIPKGLEIIVEQLGFNPWEGKSHLQDSKDGQILLCEDASDDADIFSLAEFAVEQHNAMEQDRKVELLKVTAACLETVDGGRYHIVLEAKMGKAASSGVCVYAVVLRKKTDRPTPLIVLERWLFNSRFD
ncbi:uncharacterized protein LOC141652507 isoform X2 [Silene latifolia]|uniref:uncharacterized protein LOC141652507 isoform X2 n=1 Tax=Silene latifolia TaxID=37657 RepID=UPI003D781395